MLARKGAQVPRDLTDRATVKGKGPEGEGSLQGKARLFPELTRGPGG